MEHVWKCDYCSVTGTKREIKEHEKSCPFDPNNKNCPSCLYCSNIRFTDICICDLKLNPTDCDNWVSRRLT